MDKEIVFNDTKRVNAIHFEDKTIFSKMVFGIQNVCNGNAVEDSISITDENMESQIENCVFLWDLFNINLNDKRIMNELVKYVQRELNSDMEQLKEFASHYNYCVNEIEKLTLELPIEVSCSHELNIPDFLKAMSLKVSDTFSDTLLDKVHRYIDIIKFIGIAKLIIFVNMKQFFNEQELIEIYKYAMYNEINILLLESSDCNKALEYEHVIVIDKDYEEFEI